MMRRICAMVAMVLLASSVMMGSNAWAEADGWSLALALVEQEMGYTADQLEKNELIYEDGVWAFSVTVRDHPADEDGLIVGQMDASGGKISLSGPSKISLEQQLVDDLKSCFNRPECCILLAEVCRQWNERLAGADEETLATIWEKYRDVLQMGVMIPPEDALDHEAARDAAWTQLTAAEGWTEDMADLFRLTISACYVLDDVPVYFFYWERHSYMETAYSTDRAMNQYKAELNAAFASVEQAPPLSIGVLVDARTGEMMEMPMMDYVPSQFHYLDFLIRTEDAVNSIGAGV